MTSATLQNKSNEPIDEGEQSYGKFLLLFACVLLACFLYWSKPPVSFVFDPNEQKCIPDFHLGLFVRSKITTLDRGQLVAFKPFGALSYVKNEYIIKIAAGLPGDHLVIKNGKVLINDKIQASGFPLADYYHKTETQFDVDEVIPQGYFFLMGTHPASDDSRYWGLASASKLSGYVKKIW